MTTKPLALGESLIAVRAPVDQVRDDDHAKALVEVVDEAVTVAVEALRTRLAERADVPLTVTEEEA